MIRDLFVVCRLRLRCRVVRDCRKLAMCLVYSGLFDRGAGFSEAGVCFCI